MVLNGHFSSRKHSKNGPKSTFFVHHQNHSETLSDGPKWSCHIKKWSLYISLRFLEIFLRKMVQSWLFRSTAVGSNFAKKGSSYCYFLRPFSKKMHFKNAGDAPKRSEAKRRVQSRIKHKISFERESLRWALWQKVIVRLLLSDGQIFHQENASQNAGDAPKRFRAGLNTKYCLRGCPGGSLFLSFFIFFFSFLCFF